MIDAQGRGRLKAAWALAAQGSTPSCDSARNPYRKDDPLAEVLTFLTAKKSGFISPPLIPRIETLPVSELCQLALHWAEAGFLDEAADLASSIPMDFPWMWCKENEYCESEAVSSIQLLRRALGHKCPCAIPSDPYFQVLDRKLRQIPPREKNSVLEWSLFDAGGALKCALTFSGSRTSQGACISDAADIRAFGPQKLPLNDPRGFGIRSIAEHRGRWISAAAIPEVWCETKMHRESKGVVLNLSFFGLTLSDPIAYSFYVKADRAQVGNEKLKSRTLQRYHGLSKPVVFGEGLRIESNFPGKLEVIPLAGDRGFWNCEYLAAFEMHPLNPKISITISL